MASYDDILKGRWSRALREVLASASGREVLWQIIDDLAGASSGSFAGDSALTAYNEGKRAVGLALQEAIQSEFPDEWVNLVTEQLRQARNDQVQAAASAAENEEE